MRSVCGVRLEGGRWAQISGIGWCFDVGLEWGLATVVLLEVVFSFDGGVGFIVVGGR